MHPIVEQVGPSKEQQAAVVERGRDVAVSAGAGTGKTRTIVARYLALLSGGMPLRSILAITFTNKAAREMRNRVREEMRHYLEQPGLEAAERDHWQELYNELDAARISTIHAFCSELLHAHPAEAAIDPRFGLVEEGRQAILRQQAVEAGLDWAADDPEAVRLFALLGEKGLQVLGATLLAGRLDAARALAQQAEGADEPAARIERWRAVLRRGQARAAESLLDHPEWQVAASLLEQSIPHDPGDPLAVHCTQTVEAIHTLTQARNDPAGAAEVWAAFDAIRLSAGRAGAWPGGGRQREAVKDALRTVRALWGEVRDLLAIAPNDLDRQVAEAMPSLRAFFERVLGTYTRLKEERHALDFDDLEERSLALLRDCQEALARWRAEIQAILVDEFQDTNARQRELVLLLNDGGKLTIVGDAKQSIYRFRGADASVFGRERARIQSEGGLHCELATSYRAHRGLVQALNDLLGPVLGKADPERPWVEPFAPLQPEREEAGPGLSAPFVELHLTVGTASQGAHARAARAVATRIAELMAGGCRVWEGKATRPLGYGDFAVLCRASRSFAAYEDALERAGIPYLTVAGTGFYARAEVRDLLNALRTLADPTDDLALAGLLRSPAMGLTDAALYRLVQARREAPGTSLWEMLRLGRHGLDGEQAQRAERAARIIEERHSLVGRLPVADILKGFLDDTAYRAALLAAGQGRAARNVSKLLDDAHAMGLVALGEFVEYVDGLRTTGSREGEARSTSEGAVQILSVHQAKGLEFPVVIVGDAGHGVRGGSSLLLDPDLGLLLGLQDKDKHKPAAYQWAAARDKDQEEAESDRLFYVACTRAKELLIVNGCTGIDKDGALSRTGGWLKRIAGAEALGLQGRTIGYDLQGSRAIRLDLQAGTSPVACTVYEPHFPWPALRAAPAGGGPQPAALTLPPPLLAPVTGPRQPGARERETPDRVWRVVPGTKRPRAPAWVVGKLVHEALKAWHFPAGEPHQAFERWGRARARSSGLTDARQLDDAVRRARRLLDRCRAHWLHAEMAAAEVRWHEVPYSLGEENGVIDALFRYGGRWTLVDFKTDEVRHAGQVEQKMDEHGHRVQLQRYAAASEALLGERPRCLLCWLDVEGAVRVDEIAVG